MRLIKCTNQIKAGEGIPSTLSTAYYYQIAYLVITVPYGQILGMNGEQKRIIRSQLDFSPSGEKMSYYFIWRNTLSERLQPPVTIGIILDIQKTPKKNILKKYDSKRLERLHP